MKDWNSKYPFTLDKPLKEAIDLAMKADDREMQKMLWQAFIYYRRLENYERTLKFIRCNNNV